MGWFRNDAERTVDQAPWAGPFGPPPAADSATFNPMVKTAGELVTTPDHEPVAPAAHIVAA